MFNRERTKEEFGYDLDLSVKRRSKTEVEATNGVPRKDLKVVDNCPTCGKERRITLRNSRRNKPCSKCFHNSLKMIKAKQNQNKVKSEETKQKMRDNHWSKTGKIKSPFKDKHHSERVKEHLSKCWENQFSSYTEEEIKMRYIKCSCTQRNIPVEDFDGFSAPEGTRLRQSSEGRAWRYDVMAKSRFTCDRCTQRGGKLVAHHLNSFNSYPEQRFDPNNGVCLCEECHEKFHAIYGKGDNTIEQYMEFKIV